MALDVRILGPLDVQVDGRSLPLGGPQQRAVLAVLALNVGQVVSTARLIDELWGEQVPGSAKPVLQGYVSNLRKAIGPVLVTRVPGYVLELEPEQLDLDRFERLLGEGQEDRLAGRADAAATKLREALGLWRGPALADFAYEQFAQAAIVRLEELRLSALEERIEADLALGRHAQLVGELEMVVAQQPLRERPRGQLMLALYRSGRQAEALDVYQQTRRTLVEELGIDPTPALQELERAILRQDPSLDLAGAAEGRRESSGPLPPAPERSILVVPLGAVISRPPGAGRASGAAASAGDHPRRARPRAGGTR